MTKEVKCQSDINSSFVLINFSAVDYALPECQL